MKKLLTVDHTNGASDSVCAWNNFVFFILLYWINNFTWKTTKFNHLLLLLFNFLLRSIV